MLVRLFVRSPSWTLFAILPIKMLRFKSKYNGTRNVINKTFVFFYFSLSILCYRYDTSSISEILNFVIRNKN